MSPDQICNLEPHIVLMMLGHLEVATSQIRKASAMAAVPQGGPFPV
jgi:hypothetical protein